ncbi:uncharacterized protein YjhX (UPF0386 family) [Rhizobium giardinii]|uniref:Uncharacterized protein YjhX (UPF0386 family) n=1 Tax=Rhizobium giardinii TaxID=56731 RepID=A0A7W8XB29_9HYPH|nr:uncharacterized protein YjhX (UPF0386 family) [Rhizobium giardinii]
MDISRDEQRILHLMAQGGRIEIIRSDASRSKKPDASPATVGFTRVSA